MALLDLALTLLHAAVVAGCVLLWIPRRTRRIHLGLVTVVALSWLGLGPLLGRGVGYCALTDLHWRLKVALGQRELPSSFITYLFSLGSVDASDWAYPVTAGVFAAVFLLSWAFEVRAWGARRSGAAASDASSGRSVRAPGFSK